MKEIIGGILGVTVLVFMGCSEHTSPIETGNGDRISVDRSTMAAPQASAFEGVLPFERTVREQETGILFGVSGSLAFKYYQEGSYVVFNSTAEVVVEDLESLIGEQYFVEEKRSSSSPTASKNGSVIHETFKVTEIYGGLLLHVTFHITDKVEIAHIDLTASERDVN